jgi:hypothetical protein
MKAVLVLDLAAETMLNLVALDPGPDVAGGAAGRFDLKRQELWQSRSGA